MRAACLLTLLLAACSAAEVRIAGETKVAAHRLVRLRAEGDVAGAALIWDVSDEDRLDLQEVPGGVILTGPPGTYKVKLRAIRIKDGGPVIDTGRATIVIGSAPGPDPVPPGPTPPPDDAFTRAVKAAYAAEAEADKRARGKALAALYRQAARPDFLSGVATWGALFDAMRAAASSLSVSGRLPAVQKAVAAELKDRLPTAREQALDAAGRALAAATFARVASALEAAAQ